MKKIDRRQIVNCDTCQSALRRSAGQRGIGALLPYTGGRTSGIPVRRDDVLAKMTEGCDLMGFFGLTGKLNSEHILLRENNVNSEINQKEEATG